MSKISNPFANPTRFLRLANALLPWCVAVTLLLLSVGLYFALFGSPADYQQGETVRIMYVHVPSAIVGMAGYGCVALASAVALIWKHPLADLAAKSASPIGASFTLLCLVTGSLWGKPMWGTWWAWDARLTSMLILFFLYLGHMALLNAFDDATRGAKAAAILALAGSVNLPIIKFSVDWWNTLHQPASLGMGGVKMDHSMLLPLGLMSAGYYAFFVTLLLLKIKSEIIGAKVRALRLTQAARG
jgi:heme exporter protein C